MTFRWRARRRRIAIAVPPAGWHELADGALEANPFFAPSLAMASLAHLGSGDERIAAVQAEGRQTALAPVRDVLFGRIVPAVSVWTHRYGPLGTPLIDPSDADRAFAQLVAEMAPARTADTILLFPDLPLQGAVARTIERFAAATGRPLVRIGSHHRAMFAVPPEGIGQSFRQQIDRRRRKEFARQLRRLSEQGDLVIRRVPSGPELEAAALYFLELEASGWKGQRGTALLADPASRAFALAAILDARPGEATIDEIRLDGEAIAMLVSFRAADLAVTWKIAHAERLSRFSPGVQVMIEATQAWLADPSLRRIDSLAAPGHPMIDGLWPDRIEIGLLAVGPVGDSAMFRLGVRLAETEMAAKRGLRAIRSRRSKPSAAEE